MTARKAKPVPMAIVRSMGGKSHSSEHMRMLAQRSHEAGTRDPNQQRRAALIRWGYLKPQTKGKTAVAAAASQGSGDES